MAMLVYSLALVCWRQEEKPQYLPMLRIPGYLIGWSCRYNPKRVGCDGI